MPLSLPRVLAIAKKPASSSPLQFEEYIVYPLHQPSITLHSIYDIYIYVCITTRRQLERHHLVPPDPATGPLGEPKYKSTHLAQYTGEVTRKTFGNDVYCN
jgi:hypothetical protein